MEWPDFYPENCPPVEAEPASGTVYRLVQHDPAQAKDFETPWEEYRKQFEPPTIENCGLSVHTDPQDSKKLRNRIKKFRKRQIAEGQLNPTLGVTQRTPSLEKSHHSWWVPLGTEPWVVFNIISG